jgi:hypothetical protein
MLTVDGRVKTEKRASALLPSVEGLTKSQWDAIIEAANSFAFDDKAGQAEPVTEALDDGDESEDFVLCQSETDEEPETLQSDAIEDPSSPAAVAGDLDQVAGAWGDDDAQGDDDPEGDDELY